MKKLILLELWSSRAHMRANEHEEKHTCSHHGAIHLSSVAAFTMQAWQLDIDGEEQRQREAKNQIRGGTSTADLMKISKRSQKKKVFGQTEMSQKEWRDRDLDRRTYGGKCSRWRTLWTCHSRPCCCRCCCSRSRARRWFWGSAGSWGSSRYLQRVDGGISQ